MYALVRFLEGSDPHMRHVIVVSDTHDFRPADTSDFDNKSIYDAFWREGVEDNTGFYSAQVLALGTEKSHTSSDSDGPSAHDSEMRQAENSFWKEKCTLLQDDNLFLQEQLKGYQRFSAPKSFNRKGKKDMGAVLPNITTLLTEKIQDRIKAERTLMESTNSDHNTPAAL
ncbi:hypothetical protein HPB47_018025 [Ixodes persulcatus]|uniref:Uncharacterized protein n=1 Tax=Ixodes persulcatus TaxID=34615 RepID=A0AC60R085_IXOPE|nr:hypothetical protein HPB47_018025 [Ixodes persulcatus]